MAKKMRKMFALCMALALCVSMLAATVFASNENSNGQGNTGTGQTQVHIHLEDKIGENKDSVTIVVGDNEYHGSIQGSKLEIEMDTTDNGFDFGKDESMDVGYKNNTTGETGTLTLTHKEGNGNNIDTEYDNGLNNFNGNVKPTEPEVTEPEVTEPEVTEPEVTEPEVTEPEVTEPEVTEPEVTEPEVTEPEVTEPPAPQPPVPQPQPQPQPMMVDYFGDEIEILDEEVPLAAAPKTGDISVLWIAVSGISAAGMIVLGKKREDDET